MPKHSDIALPRPLNSAGALRRLGIELEFAGLSEDRAAEIVQLATDGTIKRCKNGVWEVDTPRFGTCELYLDTRFRDDVERLAGQGAIDLARLVVPVELVTSPFDPAHLPAFDTLVFALARAGAIGSRQGLLLGFGVHLNVEIADDAPDHLWRTVTAYALIEADLRRVAGVDVSRRLLPFVQPYPDPLVDALSAGPPGDLDGLVETYLRHAPTRNHGLDMLPVFAHLAPGALAGRLTDGTATKPRPAYHFRLPDCRIDEADWSIFDAWSMWRAVERLAAAPELFDRLRRDRAEWAGRPALSRGRWQTLIRGALGDHEMDTAP